MSEPSLNKEAFEYSVLRPNFQYKFRPALVKSSVRDVLHEQLGDKQYNAEEASQWTNTVAAAILKRLEGHEFPRYKFVVQVYIGEQRGEGVKIMCRCLWDADTDSYVEEVFMNDTLFCVAIVFGIFYY